MNRATWKVYYRMLRIARREAWKATMDASLYGVGFVRIDNEGFINHLYPHAVLAEAA